METMKKCSKQWWVIAWISRNGDGLDLSGRNHSIDLYRPIQADNDYCELAV